MSAAFDCRCTWKLADGYLPALHGAISKVGAFVEDRPEVALSVLARNGDHETLELSLEAHDEGAARAVLEEIVASIESAVGEEVSPGALTRGAVTIETASDESEFLEDDASQDDEAGDEAPELMNSSFVSSLLENNGTRSGTSSDVAELVPILDPYERMRDLGTNGVSYDLDTESIVDRLEEWESDYSFEVVDVGSTHVTLRFDAVPDDLGEFAADAYEFCPDLACDYDVDDEDVDEDAGLDRAAVDAIAHGLREERVLRLWWD